MSVHTTVCHLPINETHTHTHCEKVHTMDKCVKERMSVEDMSYILPLHAALSLCKNDWQARQY